MSTETQAVAERSDPKMAWDDGIMLHQRGILKEGEPIITEPEPPINAEQWAMVRDALKRGMVVGFHDHENWARMRDLFAVLQKELEGLPWRVQHNADDDCSYVYIDEKELIIARLTEKPPKEDSEPRPEWWQAPLIHDRAVFEACCGRDDDAFEWYTDAQWEAIRTALRQGMAVGFSAHEVYDAAWWLEVIHERLAGIPLKVVAENPSRGNSLLYVVAKDEYLAALSEGAGE